LPVHVSALQPCGYALDLAHDLGIRLFITAMNPLSRSP
jgi:hypothetical protein